ncbi:hypothetical protein GJ688_19400 [Heliobacillus mobilis]|uniref:Uncharacterized protein n=2 Tax=Heliobacterium mobile TaxID=28064 RepID=A0A6I3SQT8_HELMO|nr:hypothetical protein [Heliobacterium mobile]
MDKITIAREHPFNIETLKEEIINDYPSMTEENKQLVKLALGIDDYENTTNPTKEDLERIPSNKYLIVYQTMPYYFQDILEITVSGAKINLALLTSFIPLGFIIRKLGSLFFE